MWGQAGVDSRVVPLVTGASLERNQRGNGYPSATALVSGVRHFAASLSSYGLNSRNASRLEARDAHHRRPTIMSCQLGLRLFANRRRRRLLRCRLPIKPCARRLVLALLGVASTGARLTRADRPQ